MTVIPEDILARSIDVWNRARAENSPDAIAEALMTERERCALIAEFATEFFPGLPSHHENNICVAEDIRVASLIRSPGTP